MPSESPPPRARATVPSIAGVRSVRLAAAAGLAAAVLGSAVLPAAEPTGGAGSAAAAGCPSSMQALVNAARSGGTITVPACTYHESVTVSKPMTIHAAGAVIDGDDTRSEGLVVLADDVSIDGLTVTRVKAGSHKGAVWTTGVSRFTFRNGTARDSTPICVSLNGGSGHRIVDSVLSGCAQEGFFTNGVRDTVFARNRIEHNNEAQGYDWFDEAGGGKSMASQRVTFDANEVAFNRGPGIWFDNGVADVVATNNRVHDNAREGIFFEISSGAEIAGNAVWNNGSGFAAWGYGAGITISSSNEATVHDNAVAWNARGISVISQSRNSPPHHGNLVHDNVIIAGSGEKVAGWYDDHGGSLYDPANGNIGYDNRFWVGPGEGPGGRFEWRGGLATLAAYNATAGEEGATYLTTGERDAVLAAASIPSEDGSQVVPPAAAPAPAPGQAMAPSSHPALSVRLAIAGTASIPVAIGWDPPSDATAYELQLQRDGGAWVTPERSSAGARTASVTLAVGHVFRARVRTRGPSGGWSSWTYGPAQAVVRPQETSALLTYGGRWTRAPSTGASGGYVRFASTIGATVDFAFTGSAVAWIAPRGPTRGTARVFLDGVDRGIVRLFRASAQARVVAFSASWPSSGRHVVSIRAIGPSGRARIDVDAFAIIR
ncbi:MAG TPA: right-handed parallel beta-helix repeat-containing protein [Candidatus Limnocylindrales bacterium]